MSLVLPSFGYRVQVAAHSEQGARRAVLEDAYLVEPELGVFAVADGMGGHAAGEVASRSALDEVKQAILSDTTAQIKRRYLAQPDLDARRRLLTRLARVVERAHERLLTMGGVNPEYQGMGTTLDILWLLRDQAFLAHVGDSRVYLARSTAVLQLTQDHTDYALVPQSRTRLNSTPLAPSRLLRAIGLGDAPLPDTVLVDLHPGDRFLLATDGLYGALRNEEEIGACMRSGSCEEAVSSLIQRAQQHGRDDATAVIVEIGDRLVGYGNRARVSLQDQTPVTQSALFTGLSIPRLMTALTVAVEVEFAVGASVPWLVASDRVAYVLLEGVVRCPDGRHLGPGGTLFAQSLVGTDPRGAELPRVEQTLRALRIRGDDFVELCRGDPWLAAELYRRLAEHLGHQLR